jgi:hypothetical protein
MFQITKKVLKSWNCCYDSEQLDSVFGDRGALTPLDILELEIPIEDKLWTLLHEGIFTEIELRELACRFAEEVLPIFEAAYPEDKRPRQAIHAARHGTAEERAAANAAARDAASDAANAAANAAAWSAADAAARSAAWSATNAAWSATNATRDAAWSAAREKQLEIVETYLKARTT